MKNLKKITVLLFVLFCTSFVANSQGMLTNGFSIKAVIGLPPADFGIDEPVQSSYEYDVLYGLQLGNQWYFAPQKKFGFGLMANWLDINFTYKNIDDDLNLRGTLDLSLIEVGPIGTYVIAENIALDAYYNLRPTVMATAYNIDDVTGTISGFGFTHALGGVFRWKSLSLGVEYVLGDIEATNFDLSTGDSFSLNEGNTTMSAKSLRFLIGLKF